ncbi:Uncharacterized homolog of phage Mu protein gp47 [Cedecea lapagei]|uniref:Uncharacterized homolog of phage Mu protein gp47 n=1 Tax=Cedecea lapagei TaxID=158823 RepID=A0A447UYZ1_9ENTR|nr:baseplate J/gp47 family protein [Cedecea lapagei]VEB95795.1 Uncharacterized homolog of phage Mu protein gp47 [Cedecea lapagei]
MALNTETLGLSATVTAQGITAPDYQSLLGVLMDSFRQIYGADAYLEPDSKDGQLISLVALAIHDANNTAVAVYNSFSPATAMGRALSSNVKINGIVRRAATYSTVDLLLTGVPGTTISNGSVRDNNGGVWLLPDTVSIGVEGTVIATATCSSSGVMIAPAGTVTVMGTPTRGWTAVINPQAATPGVAAETDAELRIRQSQSVALPALTPFEAVEGAIANVAGVTRHKLYENDTGAVNVNGLPPHSIAAIVDGGDVTEIAQTLRGKKGQGVATFGSTSIVVPDLYGNPHTISFSRPGNVPIYVNIVLKVFTGYTSQTGEQMKQAIADYINGLGIGDSVLLSRIYSPANLGVVSGGKARFYDISELMIGKSSSAVAAANVNIGYSEAASCSVENINITVSA